MKRLKHIINWTIWSLLGLYLLLIILIHVPAVQSFLGSQVAKAISDKLGTEVSVGRVDLGFFNRLIIDDVVIKDQKHVDMLSTNRVSVKIDLLPLLDGKFRIRSAQLFGARANFYKETQESQPNYQFVLDSLKSKDDKKESSLDLTFNSLIIRNSSVSYNQHDVEETPGILNVKHLGISDISANIVLKALTKDSLHVNVKRLTFKEKSGLQVDRFAVRLEGNRHQISIGDFILETPRSKIASVEFTGTYDMKQLRETLAGNGTISDARICPADFAALLPVLGHFQQTTTVDAAFSVKPGELQLGSLSVKSDDSSISLLASASLQDSLFHFNIAHLGIDKALFPTLKESFPALPDLLSNIGNIRLSGDIKRQPDGQLITEGELHTDLGGLVLRFTIDQNGHFNGHLDTEGLNLNRLLNNDDLGQIATQIDLEGSPESITANGSISLLEYRQYAYQNIELNGTFEKDRMEGKLKIDDPHIKTNVEGALVNGSRRSVRLTGIVNDLSPKALNLTDRWGEASFSAVIDADITASSLNDAEGSIDLDDLMMTTNDDSEIVYYLDNLHIKTGYDEGQHFVKLNGDIGEADLRGRFDWNTLPQSFINYTRSKLPTLPGLSQSNYTTDNNFELNLRLEDTEWLQKIFNIPVSFNRDLLVHAVVNDREQDIYLKGDLPSFSYGDDHYQDCKVLLTTASDTTHINMEVTKLLANDKRLNLSLIAQAGENTISSSILFDDTKDSDANHSLKGQFNSLTQLYSNEGGKPEAQVRVLPSHLTIKGKEWVLEPSDIFYSDKRLTIDNFSLHHQDQHLIIDGVASSHENDSVLVDLNGIDVGYVLDLVNFRSVRFGGLATGKAHATSVFGDFNAWAELNVKDFTFEGGAMGDLQANAYWNQDEQRIDLHAITDAGPSAQTFINGYISPVNKDLDLIINAQGTPIEFCESFTKSFMSGVNGHVFGEVRLAGELKYLYLTGDLAVTGQVTMTALNTTYTLRGDTIRFVPDNILFDGVRVYDRLDHVGTLSGGLRHQSFKHITFDMGVVADNLLAYDFPDFDGSSICGTVFVTGTADLHGRAGETIINCDVTPNKGSLFAYNASNPDAISNQQFITWRERNGEGEAPIFLTGEVFKKSIPSDLRINFRINATPDATLKVLMDANTGDNISLQGNGVINASFYNKGPFRMFGTYTTERGTYTMTIQNILKKNFNFQDGGTIIFGGDPFEAALNLNAVYTVNGVSLSDLNIGNSFTNNTVRVNCLMNILGTAGAPRVEFDLEMPTVNAEEQQMIRSVIASEQELNQQVIYLLGIGRFYTQGANNAGTQQYGQTELAMQSFLSGTVSTQINEVLSQVIKNDDWNFGANISTGNEGWHNAEYEGLVSGRMLNNRLLINGQFGYRDNATQANPSFIGDFDIRYLLFPSGNLALKVYNQTNDRYFTRSSLNTQGIGLIMKKDFNGLGDLFHSRKKKAAKL